MKSRRIVVTRSAHQASALVTLLEVRGAVPVPYPCIAIEAVKDTEDLDDGIRRTAHGEFDWMVLISANAVLALAKRIEALGIPRSNLARSRIAAIGPGTADAVRSMLGLDVALMPDEYEAEDLAEALSPASSEGSRVFLPQSSIARPVLREMLTGMGADVFAVTAYRTVMGRGGADVPGLLAKKQIDAVTFTSSSTVENFKKRLAAEGGSLGMLESICVACLGRKTSMTAAELGLTVSVSPPENTLARLVSALDDYFTS